MAKRQDLEQLNRFTVGSHFLQSSNSSSSSKKSSNKNNGKKTPVIKAQQKKYPSSNFDDLYNQYLNKVGGGGGASAGSKIDLTPYINALNEGAAANKKTISDTYAAQRNQLAQALKQYQENTATARQQAMDAYNSARADLEEQSYMNMRAAQQSAASRGLGGSGLQQLAQLSSQIESSKQTSDLSKSNTDTQNELTKALKDYEENINTQTNDLTTEERNKIAEIDANVAQTIANAQYQEEVRYQEALQQASAQNASIAASARQAAAQYALENSSNLDALNTSLSNNLSDAINDLDKIFKGSGNNKKKQESLNSTYNTYKGLFQEALSNTSGSPAANDYYNYYLNQLNNALKSYTSNLPQNTGFFSRLFG